MEIKYVHPANGDELRKVNLDQISENAAEADDRVLWEFARTLPGSATPDKLIVPYVNRTMEKPAGATTTALVTGNSANGSVRVMPFRAIVGSTVLVGTSPVEHMRGMASGYYVGTSALFGTVAIAANASGNPRWTLVYAAITPDADGDTATIVNKAPVTQVVSSNSRTVTKKNTVTVSTIDGTPAASPARPSIPSDGAGTYYIPLAFVYIPTGFGASSTVLRDYIYEVAPCALASHATGAVSCAPANSLNKQNGVVDTRQSGATSTQRPGAYLPTTMLGAEQRIILLQLGYSPLSHADGDIVDDSTDWRNRYFKYTVKANGGTNAASALASDRRWSGTSPTGTAGTNTIGAALGVGTGQSFVDDSAVCIAASNCKGVAVYCDRSGGTVLTQLASSTGFQLYVDSVTGALKLSLNGAPAAQIIVWLEATGPYTNFDQS